MKRKMILKIKLMVCLLLLAFPAWGNWKAEEVKIHYLLKEISQIKGVIVRNGTEHPPDQAKSHLLMKLKNAQDSWFAPDKEEWTAKMFIDHIASKSSLSGKPYQIKFDDGNVVNSGDWLYEQLKNYRP